MNNRVYIYFILIVLIFSCDYLDNKLKISNLIGYDISVQTYLDSVPTLNESNNTEYYLENIIFSGKEKTLQKFGGQRAWQLYIQRTKNNQLNLCVFNADSLLNYGIETIIRNKTYKMYKFSEDELVSKNWVIKIE